MSFVGEEAGSGREACFEYGEGLGFAVEEGPETLDVDGGEGGWFVERVEEGIACAERKLDKRWLGVSAEKLVELNIDAK